MPESEKKLGTDFAAHKYPGHINGRGTVLPKIEEQLEGKYNNHPTTLEYLACPDGTAALTHVVQIQNEEANSWYEAFIDAHTGELLSVTDFTADTSVPS